MQTKKALPISPLKYPGQITKVLLSADGHLLAASGVGKAVLLWDLNQQARVSTFAVYQPPDNVNAPLAMALSSDGKLLAAGDCPGGNCQISLWTVGTNKQPAHLHAGDQSPFLDLTFNTDGSQLAASQPSGITLWDTTKQRSPTVFTLPTPSFTAPSSSNGTGLYYQNIRFSPDGKQLLMSSPSTLPPFAFALWDIAQQELFIQLYQDNGVSQGGLAFSPDSQHLVSVFTRSDGANTVLLWDITPSAWQSRGCALAHRNLTQDEWQKYVPGKPYARICLDFPAGS